MFIFTDYFIKLRSVGLAVLFLCFTSLLAYGNETITSCGTTFFDNGGEDYPYLETGSGAQLSETYTICPEVSSVEMVLVSFNVFDIAVGDKLTAYDGLIVDPAFQFIAATSGSGIGSSVADSPGGGWVQASCENESGCVTLLFEWTDDNVKGRGFEADVRCLTRDIVMQCPNAPMLERIACEEGVSEIEINIPTLSICGEPSDWKVTTECEIEALPAIISGDLGTLTADFPIGVHIIRFESVMYPDMFCEVVVQIEVPNLACENAVYLALTNDCTITISPETLLEDLCENEIFDYELSIDNLYNLGTLSITSEGYYVIDLDYIDCEAVVRVQVRRIHKTSCGTREFIDDCLVNVYVQDVVAPYFTGTLLDEYEIICVADSEATLDSLNKNASDAEAALLDLGTGSALQLQSLSAVFGNDILDNCDNWTFHTSTWQSLSVDCTDNSFQGFDYDGNGIADDLLWDIMAIEFGEEATLKKYFRTIQVSDDCGNISNIAVQSINVMQPDIVAPLLDIEVSCGTDISPEALYNAWADGSHPEFATYIPNYDPTPLEVNLGDLDFAGLEDMTFTNNSGDEVPATMTHSACGYAISWDDSPAIDACGNGYKVFRDWTIYNWCDGHLEFIDVIPQVIKVIDTEVPTMTEKLDYFITSSTIVDECYAGITFFYPELEDDCSNSLHAAIVMNDEEQEFISDQLFFDRILIGESVICEVRIWDDCGNTNIYLDTIAVEDKVPPIAICEDTHIISLGLDCQAIVEAIVFDDGSYDNCSAIQYRAARLDADSDGDGYPEAEDFDTYVHFSTDDLTDCTSNDVPVVLQLEDAAGNQNSCIISVKVQDIIAPVSGAIQVQLACAENAVYELVDIRENIEDDRLQRWALNEMLLEDRLGHLEILAENCGESTLEVTYINFEEFEGNCKTGVVFFEYVLQDFCGNTSEPAEGRIDISLQHEWTMKFPADMEFFCEDDMDASAIEATNISSILDNRGCDTWALNVEETFYEGGDEACYELIREYHLINWCTWNPAHTEVAVVERPSDFLEAGEEVYLTYQDLDFDNKNDLDDGDENEADEYNITNLANDADFVLIDDNDTAYNNIVTYRTISNLTNVSATYVSAQAYGNLLYRQRIRVYDGGQPTLQLMSNTTHFCSEEDGSVEDCLANIDLIFQVNDACASADLMDVHYQIQAFNGAASDDFFGEMTYLGEGEYQISGAYPLQNGDGATEHTFNISVTDNCGNTVMQEVPVQINDCTPPTAYCIFGLSVDLDATGEAELWANDFDAGSFDNCTPKAQLRFSFLDPRVNPIESSRTFRCEDGEIGTVPVRLWVQDLAGNVTNCETFVVVQANSGDEGCVTDGVDAMLSGLIKTEGEEAIEGVEVNLSGAFAVDKITTNSGYYAFTDIDFDHDYTIAPSKNDNPLNGISTFDLVLMSKHILGIEKLDSPYKLLAADINSSRSVTTFDMVQLRRLILNLDYEFMNNTSWRFVPGNYVFPDPQNPWEGFIPEVMSFNNLAEPHQNANFIGIKIGDLNGTVSANDLTNIEGRNADNTFQIDLPNLHLASGNTYELPMTSTQFEEIEGYQYTLSYDTKALEIFDIEGVNIGTENFALLADGLITFSWNGKTKISNLLCELHIVAKADVLLSEVLKIESKPTPAEAYSQAGDLFAIQLGFKNQQAQAILYPNEPNPFEEETQISFFLPNASQATLEILDLSGKSLYEIQGNYEVGQHDIRIDLNKMTASGVLYYRLQTDGFTQARKMIRI